MAVPEIVSVPPLEAVEHFRAKGYVVGFDWRDVDAAEHLASFTVAKGMRLEILEGIREAVDEAITEGTSFRDFEKRLTPFLQAEGWWGRQEMIDDVTGERRLVQLGSPRRLRTIFDTNIRMAGAHGRWQRIERLKEAMPYLRYVSVRDRLTRPEHALWHGTVLPVDHPWWRTHYPPNGWGCRCLAVQLADDDLRRFGYRVSKAPPVRNRGWINKRTGATVQVPAGIDPGFQHNVGLLGRVKESVRIAEERHGRGSIVAAPPANPATWQEYAIVGRDAVEGIAAGLGSADAGAARTFRRRLLERLGDRIGGTTPDVVSATGGRVSRAATRLVQESVRNFLPASWIEAGNGVRAAVRGRSGRNAGGSYHHRRKPPELHVDASPATSVHEYVHHLQYRVPGFHDAWREFYKARTTLADGTVERAVASKYGRKYPVRKDAWLDDYMGHTSTLELAARTYEILSHGLYGREAIADLMRQDPELLHFAVGFLLRFEP